MVLRAWASGQVSVHDPRQDVEEDSRSLYDWSRSRKQEQEAEIRKGN